MTTTMEIMAWVMMYFLPKIIINIIKLIVLYVKKTLRINIQKFLKQKMGD